MSEVDGVLVKIFSEAQDQCSNPDDVGFSKTPCLWYPECSNTGKYSCRRKGNQEKRLAPPPYSH